MREGAYTRTHLGHEGLNLLDLFGDSGEVIVARVGNDDAILQTDTTNIHKGGQDIGVEEGSLLGVLEGGFDKVTDKVATGFNGDNHACLEGTTHTKVTKARFIDGLDVLGVPTDIVDIQANEMTKAMGEEDGGDVIGHSVLLAGALLDDTSGDEAIQADGEGKTMHVLPLDTGTKLGEDCLLHGKSDLVDDPGFTDELSTDGPGTGDVSGITVELCASIDQDELTGLERGHVGVILTVVKDGSIGAGPNDGQVGLEATTHLGGLVAEKGIELAFIGGPLGGTHQGDVGITGDFIGVAKQGDLLFVLNDASLGGGVGEVGLVCFGGVSRA